VPPDLEILMQLPVKSAELVSVYLEASLNLKCFFLNNSDAKKFKTISAYTVGTDLIFKTFKKFFIS
jgi:hypothetical protein